MKFLYLILCLFLYTSVYPITYISNSSGSWTTTTIWTPNGTPGPSDVITILSGHNITYNGTLTQGVSYASAGNITINSGGILNITNGLVQSDGSRSIFINNGTVNITSDGITQKQGNGSALVDRTILTNNGTMNIVGDYKNNQNTSFTNGSSSIINFTNCNFTTNQNAYFTQNGTINIDNSSYPGKNVNFSNCNFANDVLLNIHSTFNVKKSNVSLSGMGTMILNGQLNVEDGNISETMSITIGSSGVISTKDTDSSGDGVVSFNNGGQTITNNGSVYIESMTTTGGGITLLDNNLLFVHNIGSFANNSLNVSSSAQLYYCNNPVRLTPIGTISAGGKLYYSKETGSYTTTTPRDNPGELDFTVGASDQIDMSTIGMNNCNAAFYDKLSTYLPITLTKFSAKNEKELILIEWETSSEKNNDYFSLFRSYDGMKFDKIIDVKGAGNSTNTINYQYNDYDFVYGINYYKLKQTDYDGKSVDSKIISIKRDDFDFNIIIYPNPSTNNNLKMIVYKNLGLTKLKCVNSLGQIIFSENINIIQNSVYELGKYNLPNGKYYINIETENTIYIKEIIIKN